LYPGLARTNTILPVLRLPHVYKNQVSNPDLRYTFVVIPDLNRADNEASGGGRSVTVENDKISAAARGFGRVQWLYSGQKVSCLIFSLVQCFN
jgi:hypothetical protein